MFRRNPNRMSDHISSWKEILWFLNIAFWTVAFLLLAVFNQSDPKYFIFSLIFVAFGCIAIVFFLADVVFDVKRKHKVADIPINMLRWGNATKLDIVLGIFYLLFLIIITYQLSYAVLGMPPSGLVPAALGSLRTFYIAGVATLENALFIGIVVGTTTAWSTYLQGRTSRRVNGKGYSDKTIKWTVIIFGIIAALAFAAPFAYLFHGAIYEAQQGVLLWTYFIFALWGSIAAVRQNTLAADIGHFGYNLLAAAIIGGFAVATLF